MENRDDSRNPQAGANSQQPSMQQGASASSSGQQDQFSGRNQQGGNQQGGVQQGGAQQGGMQQGGTQGGNLSRRGGGIMPSLWGGRGGPFELMRRLDEDMDRLFHQVWGSGRNLMRGRGGSDMQSMWMPQVEVFERDGKLHVHADLPGMKKEDVKLSIDADQLVIQGERRSSHEEGERKGGGYYHTERSYGSFYRAIPLPDGVDPSTADASFKDGVLDVTLDAPRTQQAQSRQIDIR
jgi:HSP20 family protein